MTTIDNDPRSSDVDPSTPDSSQTDQSEGPGEFGQFLDNLADGALEAVSTVAPALPGGKLVAMAADGLQGLNDQKPDGLASADGDQLDQMWEMQQENQVYNMQYLKLQQAAQRQNRRFKALSNLMKVRHDTAKSAINNMRA